MDVPPGLLAAADQVYAEMLDDLALMDGPVLGLADFTEEFEFRLRTALGADWWAASGESEDGRPDEE